MNQIVPRHGCPRTILSDGAKAFNSKLMDKVFVLLNAKKITTSPYNPQHNGQVERFNHTLVQMLTVFVNKNQKDWDRYLGIVMGAYHSCPHATTGYSPNYMLYGRELPLPIDQVLKANEKYESIEDYFNILLKRTSFAQDLVKARMINRAVKLEEQQTDLQYRIDYKFGERVYLFIPDSIN
jgi:transposase InsO family protein